MSFSKQKIINVSIDLFAEKGVEVVSVVKIAKHAGLSNSGVYHHFKHGKKDIISAILNMFEDCIRRNMPNSKEWEDKNANAAHILSRLFFKFETSEAIKYRKITRIIIAGMHYNRQIKAYAEEYFIDGRERLLAQCFTALANNSLIPPLRNPERAARVLNSLLIRFAIKDSTNYPYNQEIDEVLFLIMRGDCERFISCLQTDSSLF